MRKIYLSLFLVIITLFCSCNNANNISSNRYSTPEIYNAKLIEKEALSMVDFCNRGQAYNIENEGVDGLSFKLCLNNDDVIYEVRCDSSYLYTNNQSNQNKRVIYVSNNEIVIWQMGVYLPILYLGYIDIIARIGTNIVGYATIYLEPNDISGASCQKATGHLLDAKIFPKINGVFQKVTHDYVENKIVYIKNRISSIPLGNYEGEVENKEIIENDVFATISVENRVYYLDNEKNPAYKNYEGIKYMFKSINNKLTFKCSIDGVGSFSKEEKLTEKTVNSDEILCWYPTDYENVTNLSPIEKKEQLDTYIDVIMYDGNIPVGFAVIEIFNLEYYFTSFVLKSIEISKINGSYKIVASDYIYERINDIKDSHKEIASI